MKPSDFFIGSRQFFGYIAPGAICISAWMLFIREPPVVYLSEGDWAIRLILFLGLSYVVGFVIQTLVFWMFMKIDKGEWRWGRSREGGAEGGGARSEWLPPDVERVLPFLQQDLGIDDIPRERVPRFCRNVALEYCTYARYRIIELESEINFMVALAVTLPVLAFMWAIYEQGEPAPWILFGFALGISIMLLGWRIPELRRNEKAMWCEKYLILRARKKFNS